MFISPNRRFIALMLARKHTWARDNAHKEEILAGLRHQFQARGLAFEGSWRDGP